MRLTGVLLSLSMFSGGLVAAESQDLYAIAQLQHAITQASQVEAQSHLQNRPMTSKLLPTNTQNTYHGQSQYDLHQQLTYHDRVNELRRDTFNRQQDMLRNSAKAPNVLIAPKYADFSSFKNK